MFKTVERSWGKWIEICRFKRLCIKVLCFKKASHISKQRHQFRSERWFILDGMGTMIMDDYMGNMEMFDSALVEPNAWHQFITPFHRGCNVLEIQYGEDVREDDIERV